MDCYGNKSSQRDWIVEDMNLDNYQNEVARTCGTTDRQETIKMSLIGMLGEMGEISDPLKKHLYHGHDLDLSKTSDEIGDLLWYLTTLVNSLGLSLDGIIRNNIAKLRARYPDGFSNERSINRTI